MSAEGKPTVDDDDSVSMLEVLAEESRMQEDASAVLGGSDDQECTYAKGYVKRQALYACSTCATTEPAAICLACSYHCHEGHDLYELYTKRHFRCDCGNSKFKDASCKLVPLKAWVNEENQYNQNFKGAYCTCARPYPDPEDEIEDDMIQCVVCEDWYHGRHLGTEVPESDGYQEMICAGCMARHPFLWAYQVSSSAEKVKKESEGDDEKVDVGGGEGERSKPDPSQSAAQQSMPVKPESPSEPVTEPAKEEPVTEPAKEEPVTEPAKEEPVTEPAKEEPVTEPAKEEPVTEPAKEEPVTEPAKEEPVTEPAKEEPVTEPAKEEPVTEPAQEADPGPPPKRKVERCSPAAQSSAGTAGTSTSAASDYEPPAKRVRANEGGEGEGEGGSGSGWKGGCLLQDLQKRQGTVNDSAAFWREGWRQKLCSCTACLSMYKAQGVAYIPDVEDTVSAYEEKGRSSARIGISDQEQEQSLLSGMSHTQKIEMISGFNDLKTELSDFLRGFAQSGKVVSSADIKEFFDHMEKRKKERLAGSSMQYFCK